MPSPPRPPSLPPKPVPAMYPNLPALYRRKVEALELALREPATMTVAAAALRSLIDAVLVYPGERRGELRVELRGDLAAFLHLQEPGMPTRTAVALKGNGRSGEVVGTSVAGAGNHRQLTSLRAIC